MKKVTAYESLTGDLFGTRRECEEFERRALGDLLEYKSSLEYVTRANKALLGLATKRYADARNLYTAEMRKKCRNLEELNHRLDVIGEYAEAWKNMREKEENLRGSRENLKRFREHAGKCKGKCKGD